MNNLQAEYLSFLIKNSDKERALKDKAYLYSDLKHYGVSSSIRREFTALHLKEISSLNKKSALELVGVFWKQPSHEERSFALTILNIHKAKLTLNDMPMIERMMRESRGWAFLDSLIIPLMPIILTKYPEGYSYLSKWILDDDFWVRRSALLSQILFFRENNGGDRELFYKLAVSQFDERWVDEIYGDSLQRKRARFFIRKAIGWTIREISGKDPKSAYNFLKKYKNQMSGLSLRDGSRKLPREFRRRLG